MRAPLLLLALVLACTGHLATAADDAASRWAPSPAAIATLKDLSAVPLDRARTALVAGRFLRLLDVAKPLPAPSETATAQALEATWIVSSCWKPEFVDQRMQAPDEEDVQRIRDYFAHPEEVQQLRTRLTTIRTEYGVYTAAISTALDKALCPKERADAILFHLRKHFVRQQAIQRAMADSPLWWRSLARLTIDAGSIVAKVVEPVPNAGEPPVAPAARTTWADRSLQRFPLALDPAVSASTAAAALGLDADRTVMSLANL